MLEKEKKLINQRLYDFPAGGFCGVIMPEKVMRKITKLNAKYSAEIKKILTEQKDELHASEWTLANKMNGDKIEKQVTINYVYKQHPWITIEDRIKLFEPPKPRYIKECYLVSTMEEAKEIAQQVLQEVLAA